MTPRPPSAGLSILSTIDSKANISGTPDCQKTHCDPISVVKEGCPYTRIIRAPPVSGFGLADALIPDSLASS